jgi:hypothetical protein
MDKRNESTKTQPQPPAAKSKKITEAPAEYKYIGDDGGRWVFERRSDHRVITIDKPMNLPPGNPSTKMVRLSVHGFRVNDQVIALCKK